MTSKLTDQDLREVLARAEAIQEERGRSGLGSEEEAFLQAATETGISREAVERALRERLQLPLEPPKVGERVFAKSTDDCFYVAEVIEERPDGLRVRFLKGGAHLVAASDLRNCSLLPGANIYGFWKDWGWCPVTITSYDAKADRLTVSDWWGTDTISVSEIRLQPPKRPASKWKSWLATYGLGFLAGLASSFTAWFFFLR